MVPPQKTAANNARLIPRMGIFCLLFSSSSLFLSAIWSSSTFSEMLLFLREKYVIVTTPEIIKIVPTIIFQFMTSVLVIRRSKIVTKG
ncbi:MAG: hypothetical protein ACTSQ4_10405 [Candidatus Heimdallarchaeaceae archaeon]